MKTLTLTFDIPGFLPVNGFIVKYRVIGSNEPYQQVNPNPINSPVVISNLPDNKNIEGFIMGDCGWGNSTIANFQTTNCICPENYTSSPDGSYCYQVLTTAPNITTSNVCFAPVTNFENYSIYGTRVYNPGLSLGDISRDISRSTVNIPGGDLDAVFETPYWKSPMNNAGIWLDSDCDGNVDPLTANSVATISWSYINPGGAKQVYIGIGADNQFILQVNNNTIAQTTSTDSSENFRNWHLIPITFINGYNTINVMATGDGTTNDCIAFIVYDNNIGQLQQASDDSQLIILFSTASLRNTRWNVATCQPGYDLDTSGGIDNYICRRTLTVGCE
jgi:hypothetical protein